MYDPERGGYLSFDPIGLAGGLNPFAYTFNNPINWIDPFGLDTWSDAGIDIGVSDPLGDLNKGDPYIGNDGSLYTDQDICIVCKDGDTWYIETPGELTDKSDIADYFEEWKEENQNTEYYCPQN